MVSISLPTVLRRSFCATINLSQSSQVGWEIGGWKIPTKESCGVKTLALHIITALFDIYTAVSTQG